MLSRSLAAVRPENKTSLDFAVESLSSVDCWSSSGITESGGREGGDNLHVEYEDGSAIWSGVAACLKMIKTQCLSILAKRMERSLTLGADLVSEVECRRCKEYPPLNNSGKPSFGETRSSTEFPRSASQMQMVRDYGFRSEFYEFDRNRRLDTY